MCSKLLFLYCIGYKIGIALYFFLCLYAHGKSSPPVGGSPPSLGAKAFLSGHRRVRNWVFYIVLDIKNRYFAGLFSLSVSARKSLPTYGGSPPSSGAKLSFAAYRQKKKECPINFEHSLICKALSVFRVCLFPVLFISGFLDSGCFAFLVVAFADNGLVSVWA